MKMELKQGSIRRVYRVTDKDVKVLRESVEFIIHLLNRNRSCLILSIEIVSLFNKVWILVRKMILIPQNRLRMRNT